MAFIRDQQRDADLAVAEKYIRFLHNVMRPLSAKEREVFFGQINIQNPGNKSWGSLTRHAERRGVNVQAVQQHAAEGKKRLRRRFDQSDQK